MSEPILDPYVVWSNEHRAYWGPGRVGYTRSFNAAGRYSQEVAFEICRTSLPTAAHIGMVDALPIRVSDMNAFLEGGLIPPNVL